MALTLTGKVLVLLSLSVGLIGVFWPEVEKYFAHLQGSTGGAPSNDSACPLGYTGPNPHKAAKSRGSSGSSSSSNQPITWFVNCTVWTADSESPWLSYLAVDESGLLLDEPPPQQLAARHTLVNLNGSWVMPGFIDPHIHLIPAGLQLSAANLRHVSSREQFRAAAAAAARSLSPGEWLLGGFWAEANWGGELPSAAWLEGLGGGLDDMPMFLHRLDGHTALANHAAMRLAGITADTAAPEGGVIERDEGGTPTGIFRDAALALIAQHIPKPSLAQLQAALSAALARLAALGVTSVGDMGRWPFTSDPEDSWRDLEQLLEPAAAAGGLTARVSAYLPMSTWGRLALRLTTHGSYHPKGTLRWPGVKEFADGSLGSRTALFWQPYADDSSHSGERQVQLEVLRKRAKAAAKAGLQVAVHAIGDRAVDEVLEVLELLPGRAKGVKHRIEHVQHISGGEVASRLAAAGLVGVPNPQHLITDRGMLVGLLGLARAGAGRAFAYKTLLDAGVRLGFGSDWPVVDVEPLASLYAAAFRRGVGEGPEGAWEASECVSLEQALLGHTAEAAAALLAEGEVGRLVSGLKADFVALSGSPLELMGAAGEELPRVLQTYLGGKCIYGCEGANGGEL